MESLRLILLIIGALIVGLVLLDFYRRTRHERRKHDEWEGIEPSPGDEPLYDEVAGLEGLNSRTEDLPPDFEGVGEVRVRPAKPAPEPPPATPPPEASAPTIPAPDRAPAPRAEPRPKPATPPPVPEQVFAVHIMARDGERFAGPALLDALGSAGMLFGELGIFHYHVGQSLEGEALFSVANVLKPGTLEPAAMETFETPGLVMFMGLPGPSNPMIAFDTMIKAARHLAKQLDGELRDDRRSVLTEQTVQHQREQIQEYKRKHLTPRAKH